MGQTIICEYLSAWESTGVAPEPKDFGFDGLYAMLEECQETMFSIGESVNRSKERISALEQEVAMLKAHNGLISAELGRTKRQLFDVSN